MLIGASLASAACPPTAPDLLAGRWHGRESDEHWVAVGEDLVGLSLEPAFFELLRVSRVDGYVARPAGGDATVFACASSGPGSVRFEAPEHDWPTTVAYERTTSGLRVRVGGGEGRDLVRRWRSFTPTAPPMPDVGTLAPTSRLWWGDAPLDAARLPSVTWEVRATASRGALIGVLGRATLDGEVRAFSAVWTTAGGAPALAALSAW